MNQDTPFTLLLCGARVVLSREVLENASLLIEDAHIKGIVDAKATDESGIDAIFDLSGATILPGFIDIHIHGAIGVDVTTASADEMQRVARYLAERGTTAWLPTLVPARDEEYASAVGAMNEVIEKQDEQEVSFDSAAIGARILGVHYEGPFVNVKQCGALRVSYFKDFAGKRDELDFMVKLRGGRAVHLTTLAPEIANGIELVRELVKQNWIVAIGHTQAEVDVLDAARAAGATHLTHFMNAMTGLHHRSLGVVGWGFVNDDVTCDVIADGVHVDSRVLNFIVRAKGRERVILISDAVAPTGLGDGEFHFWDETITVKNGRTRNERGGIAGSVITMLDAVKMMLRLGISIVDVARMASLNPARLLKIDDEYGSIETGKRADLVAIDDDGNVRLTMIGGRVAFQNLTAANTEGLSI